MAIVDYPTGLGTVLMTKSRSQAATFGMAEPKSGPGYTKNTSIDVPVFWDVTFKFKASDAQRFQAWFVSTLNRGRNPFNMLLSTEFGNVSHVCQLMPDSLLPQSREANVHTYTAQIRSEAIKYPQYIEENLDFVASEFWPLRAEWDYALNSLTPVSSVPSNPVGTTASFTDGLYYDNTQVNFSDLVTFSRLSAGSYIDTDGVLKTAAIGEPRFEAGGLLVEPQSTNLVVNSSSMITASGWSIRSGGASQITNETTSPDGTFNAIKAYDIGIQAWALYLYRATEIAENTTNTVSCYFKIPAGTGITSVRVMYFMKSSTVADWQAVEYRVSGGYVQNPRGGNQVSVVPTSYGIQEVGNGWFRLHISANSLSGPGTTAPQFSCRFDGSSTGDGSKKVYMAFPQVEQLSAPTSYIATAATTVTRASDSATVDMQPHAAGTIFAEFLSDAVAIERVVYAAGSVTLKRLATGAISVTTGAVTVTSSVVPSGSVKAAISYDGNTLKLAVNGVVYSASSALPSVGVSIALGNTTFANVWQRSEAYDNALLIEVTQ